VCITGQFERLACRAKSIRSSPDDGGFEVDVALKCLSGGESTSSQQNFGIWQAMDPFTQSRQGDYLITQAINITDFYLRRPKKTVDCTTNWKTKILNLLSDSSLRSRRRVTLGKRRGPRKPSPHLSRIIDTVNMRKRACRQG
jgi:hypothetical protein